MKRFAVLLLILAATTAHAKEQIIPLSKADAAALSGKTVAVTFHQRPSFVAMTPGKAGFALFGAAAMISAGNKLVDENHIEDPAVMIRRELSTSLTSAYGALLQPVDTTATEAKKPKEIAATHPQADYVLDVQSTGWMFSYRPTQWDLYWVGYSVQVKLVDAKTSRVVSNLGCNTNTQAYPAPPKRDELEANGAVLLKEITAALGWNCLQLVARQQFLIPEDKIAVTPAELMDPIAARRGKPKATVAAAPVAPVAPAAVQPGVAEAADASPAAAPVAPAAPADAAGEPEAGAAPAAAESAPASPR